MYVQFTCTHCTVAEYFIRVEKSGIRHTIGSNPIRTPMTLRFSKNYSYEDYIDQFI